MWLSKNNRKSREDQDSEYWNAVTACMDISCYYFDFHLESFVNLNNNSLSKILRYYVSPNG